MRSNEKNEWIVYPTIGWPFLKSKFKPLEDFSFNGKTLQFILEEHKRWIESERKEGTQANLEGADLKEVYLKGYNLEHANLKYALLQESYLGHTKLNHANLEGANLSRANMQPVFLNKANLIRANLKEANLEDAILSNAHLEFANLYSARLPGVWAIYANLQGANLQNANLQAANLACSIMQRANLQHADLSRANLNETNLQYANLQGADLSRVSMLEANLEYADFTGSRVYGVSAWNIKIKGTKQSNLIISLENEPNTTVDNIEMAQFIYLLIHNKKIRDVINTITSKVVLILGRFTSERKAILDAIREELRNRDYLPVLFDFEKPLDRDLTETVSTLAHLARFIIADITEPRSIPHELATIVPTLAVPIQPLILDGVDGEYGMFNDLKKYQWILRTYRYKSSHMLISTIGENVISPAENMVETLRRIKNW